MTIWDPRANDLFLKALEIPPSGERQEYLDRACGGDAALRAEVASLLEASARAGSFLESPVAAGATGDLPPVSERPGTMIGPYKLLQQIGEGGMGTVFLAEQTQPVRRQLALKVIKAGMDSRQVVARFEAERQALALMDHVNIARVFDGGTTETGRPYFVMELVHGIPITKYCDDNRLTPRQRLELFVPVCQAIQHAHQKGIIHRDVKPSNVLVTLYDGKPVAKVIDFGVAKAIEQTLVERSLFTQFGTMVGTLEYMSPEQAELSGLGVDTRSDVYSLGVLLYELLTGTTPLSRRRMKEAAYAEIVRLIKEEEPPRPSTRLSDSGEALASISANRHTEPAKLTRLVKGELDWIVMKCLEKDRNRRYETANGFAADVQRYLNDEPVQACPPSAGYRCRKFARRNRGALATAAVVGVALVAGTAVSTWMAVRATRAERLAEQRLDAETKAGAETEAARQQALAHLRNAHAAVDRLLTRVGEQDLAQVPQMQPVQRKLLEDALEFNRAFLAAEANNPGLALEVAKAQVRVGGIHLNMGLHADAERACLAGIEMLGSLARQAPDDLDLCAELVRAHIALAYAQDWTDPTAGKSTASRRRAVALADRLVAGGGGSRDRHLLRVESLVALCSTLINAKQAGEAEPFLRQALDASRAFGDEYSVGRSSHQLGRLCRDAGRLEQAERHFRAAAEAFRRHGHEATWVHRLSMGELRTDLRQVLEMMGRGDDARAENDKALFLFDGLARDYPDRLYYGDSAANAAEWLGAALDRRGRADDAAVAYRKALGIQFRVLPRAPLERRRHDNLKKRFKGLDDLLARTQRLTERQQIARDVITLYDSLLADHPGNATLEIGRTWFLAHLASLAVSSGTPAEAEQAIGRAVAGWERLVADNPGDAEDRQALAENCAAVSALLVTAGRREEAEQHCTTAIGRWPDTATLHLSRARVLVALRRPEKALADFSKAIDLAPHGNETPWWYLERSGVYVSIKREGEALADLDRATERWPAVWDVWVWRGNFHLGRERWDRAVADLSKAVALNASYWPAWHSRGWAHARLRQWDAAIRDFAKAAEVNPTVADPHHDLAWLLATCPDAGLRQPARAVESAKKAVELAPQAGRYWATLGAAQYRAGDWKAAVEALTKSMQLGDGGGGVPWFFLAMAHRRLDQKTDARRWYDRAVQWTEANAPRDDDFRRLRGEAAELLGIEK